MSRVHLIRQVQRLPVSLEETWDFFSRPENLAVITPPHLNLRFTNETFGDEIYPGQIITYNVKPLLRIPLFWMTEITHVERHKLFVDEQRKGPYAMWHHQHHFKSIDDGVEMTDIVHYKLPFGLFGALGKPLVTKQLNEVFAYRKMQVEKLFGTFG
jgi:ligand-binding SRPBCC domain-containing protein